MRLVTTDLGSLVVHSHGADCHKMCQVNIELVYSFMSLHQVLLF